MKFLKTLRKRGLALFLVLTMCMSLLPAQALAAEMTQNPLDGTGVTASKEAVGPDENGNYTVTLKVQGDSHETSEQINYPADVVLVVDTSTSMLEKTKTTCGSTSFEKKTGYGMGGSRYTYYQCNKCGETYREAPTTCTHKVTSNTTRLEIAKTAAKAFVAGLLDASNQIQIGLCDFSGTARTNMALTSDRATIEAGINALDVPRDWWGDPDGDGTNYSVGLNGAKSILQSSPGNRQKFIVFLSDGAPSDYLGTGDGDGQRAAKNLRDDGVTIITVGIDASDAADALKKISSPKPNSRNQKHYYAASTDGSTGSALNVVLDSIKETIKDTIYAGTNAKMEDVINLQEFDVVREPKGEGVDYNEKTGVILWEIGNIGKEEQELSFVVKPKADTYGILHTNKSVELTFDSSAKDGEKITADETVIGHPEVEVTPPKPTDKDVEDIIPGPSGSAEGKVKVVCVNSFAAHDAKTFGWKTGGNISDVVKDEVTGKYTSTVTLNPTDYTDQYDTTGNKHYAVTGDPEKNLPVTITLTWNNSTKKWETSDNVNVTFYVNCDPQVIYDKGDAEEGTPPEATTVKAGTPTIISDAQSDLKKTGHTFAGWTFKEKYDGVTLDTDGKTFIMPGHDVVLVPTWKANQYTVTIFYQYAGDDGIHQHGDKAAESVKIQQDYDTDYSQASPSLTGYTVDEETVSGKIPAKDTTIFVTYRKNDKDQTVLSYNVVYMVDGVQEGTTQTYQQSVWSAVADQGIAIQAGSVNTADRTGYRPATVTFSDDSTSYAEGAMVKNGETITVTYVRDDSQTKPTSYTVQHVIGGEVKATQTYNGTAWINETNPTIVVENGSLTPYTKDTAEWCVGYKYSETTAVSGTTSVTAAEGGEVPSGTIVTLTYVRDDSQTQDTRYTVSHKIGDNVIDTREYTGTDWINEANPKIEIEAGSLNPQDCTIEGTSYYGYQYSSTSPDVCVGDKVTSGTEIVLTYVPNDEITNRITYTVTYTKDDVEVPDESKTYGDDVWVNDEQVVTVKAEYVATPENKFPGYKFDNITVDGTVNDAVAGSSVADGTQIVINYVKDENQTKKLTYTVQYTIGETVIDGFGGPVTEDVWVNDPDTIKVTEKYWDFQSWTRDSTPAAFVGYKAGTPTANIGSEVKSGSIVTIPFEKDDTWTVETSYKVKHVLVPRVGDEIVHAGPTEYKSTSWVKDEPFTAVVTAESIAEATDIPVGYTFDSYSIKDLTAGAKVSNGTEITLYYKDVNTGKLSVTYKGEGVEENTSYVEPDAQITIAQEPTLEGYVFLGWASEDGVKHQAGEDYIVTADVVFTAQWEAVRHSVSLDKELTKVGDADYVEGAKVYPGDVLTYTVTVTNTGNVALPAGAQLEDSLAGIITLQDALDPNAFVEKTYTYTVPDDAAGKTVVNKVIAKDENIDDGEGDEVTTPVYNPSAAVTKVLSTVNGAPYTGGSVSVGDRLVYTVTVTNNGDVELNGVTVSDELTGNIWTVNGLAVGESEDLTTNAYTVPADLAGGSVSNTAVAEVPNGASTPGTKTTPVYARYTLTYNMNGGIGGPLSDGIWYRTGSTASLSQTAAHADQNGVPVVLVGWSRTPDTHIYTQNDTRPAGLISSVTFADSDITVYAVWGLNENSDVNEEPDVVESRYTVTYTDGADGNVFTNESHSNLLEGTETPAFAGGTPVREGYTFNGWSPAVADTVTGTVTYTAQWTANTPTPVPPIVVPPVTIPDGPTPLAPGGDTILDDEVPLAAPGLNSTDHFDYVKGYEDGTVRPEANITRAEVATIFFRLMTNEFRMENWATENSFSDVAFGTWYNNAISTATKAGILNGYPEGDFRPENSITRAEFASIAARFASEEVTQRGRFSDIQGHWAEENIERAAAAGWITGSEGKFRPDDYITRAEVIVAVNRMLDRVPDEDHLLEGMKTFVDNVPGMWYYADVQEATNSHDYERDETGISEVWTELKPDQDWTALEKEWADAAAANVADVAANLNGGSESEGETEDEAETKTED